ncbi:MAG: hypothetical protein ACE5ES_04240, partial [Candidatus Nanoarchaeia archaeon]
FLKECNRILKKYGIARISPGFGPHFTKRRRKKPANPKHYQEFWEIWDKGKEVKPDKYLNRIRGIKVVWKSRGKGDKPMYVEIKKQKKLDFKLRLVASVDFNYILKDWGGVKSIYTTQLKFKPRYKVK